jgi:hypothetical protein
MKRENKGQRIEIQKRAKFTLKDEKRGWEQCVLQNLNQNLQGLGIRFFTTQDIKVNAIVIVHVPDEFENQALSIAGIVRWIKKEENDMTGGIELIGNTDKLKKFLPQVWSS